ncbi:unnamed protein product [Phytophthora fragariaefolia]|uniref:Unnamed protein product n=1 Tax=Phytophthora fragariaefolia TaxID=1490495 RepID=A0A9W6YH53_9STRA|nr:unnamed protein product [Phytophthora fragariaefolia]
MLGGSSFVGVCAVQSAPAIGVHVIATASAENAKFVKALGADQIIDYRTEKWVDVVKPHSIDVFYNCGMENAAWNEGVQVALKENMSRFVTILPMTQPVEESKSGAKPVGEVCVYPSAKELSEVTEYIESGKVCIRLRECPPASSVGLFVKQCLLFLFGLRDTDDYVVGDCVAGPPDDDGPQSDHATWKFSSKNARRNSSRRNTETRGMDQTSPFDWHLSTQPNQPNHPDQVHPTKPVGATMPGLAVNATSRAEAASSKVRLLAFTRNKRFTPDG